MSKRVNIPLATAIARGLLWMELIESEEYPTVTALADDLKIDQAYVARHVRMTLLSLGLVRKILRENEPESLTMGRLRSCFPMDWEAQERDLVEAEAFQLAVSLL
jgi:predicted transcriptional regulator